MAKKSNFPLSDNSSILFVTFSRWVDGKRLPTNGSLDPLRDVIGSRVKKLVIIDQIHPGSDRVMPRIEVFNRSSEKFKLYRPSWWLYMLKPFLPIMGPQKTQILFKLRDFLSVIDWGFCDKTKFDYCICLESINTIAAIILRKFGRVKKVVYYVSDYSPKRYPSKWFNSIYIALDRFCAMNADFIWDVSPAMQPARIEVGLNPEKSAHVINVPNGLYPAQIKANPISKVDKHALIYMGTVGADNGPDIAIKALVPVRKKFKDAKLHIIGGTKEDFMWLERIVKKLKLEKYVISHGFVEDGIEMSRIIKRCAIGLAPYRDIPGSIRKYADAGKIRAYCAAGLPVVSSQVPPLGQQVANLGGAVITHDDPKSFSDAVIKIFSDKKLYNKLRKNAIAFAKDSTWENTFSNAFKLMSKS